MGAVKGWTEAENRRLVQLHGQGLTQAKVCQEMDRAPATIQRKAKALGLSWNGANREGPSTKAAQNEDRRTAMLTRLEQRAVELIEMADPRGITDLVKGEYGSEQKATLDFLPTKSAQQLTSAIRNLTGAITDLQKLQNLHTDSSDLDSWLKAKIRLEIIGTTDPGTFTTGDENAPRSTGELSEGIQRGTVGQ